VADTVLFDLDGTLTNPAVGIVRCWQHALDTLGVTHDEAVLRSLIGPPLHHGFAQLLKTDDPAAIERGVGLYRERFSTVGLFENELFPEIPTLLEALRARGSRLYVATSKPTVYSERIIEHFGLAPYFDKVYGSELSGERADKRHLLRYIVEQEHLDVTTTTMVGDRLHDVNGAKVCNMRSVGVLWGFGSREELELAGADEVVETIFALAHVLLRQSAAVV
jgi:phosphoglycolate phosphatase